MMPAVTIPGVGRVNFPDTMALSEIQAAAQKLAGSVGRDPNTGERDPDLAILDQLMAATSRGRPASQMPARITPPFLGGRGFKVNGMARDLVNAASNIDDKTSTPIVLGTMGALAFPPSAAASGAGLLARFAPSVLGAGAGGATGGGLAESQDPNATRRSIAGAALRGGAMMAATEAGGLGLGAVANRMIAPNLARYADPMKPVRDRIAASGLPEFLRAATSRVTAKLPQTGRVGAAVQRAGRFAATPLGGELLEAAVVPAATAAFGPAVGIPMYLARAALAPGVLQRYLSRRKLPSELARLAGRQATTTAVRGGLRGGQQK